MENILKSNKEIELMTTSEKKEYFENVKKYCETIIKTKKKKETAQKLMQKIYPIMRNYDYEIIGEENVPQQDNVIFVCNHSNSHDFFTAMEFVSKLEKTATVLAGSDCLSLLSKTVFNIGDATFIDRTNKESTFHGMLEFSKKIIEGKCGVIFGESTWNLHPILPMQQIKIGAATIGAITSKMIVPTIIEYVEVPELCEKESELYTKCIICFGRPIKIDESEDLIQQTQKIQNEMEMMRKNLWKKIGIKKDTMEDINKEIYLNHTYIKKFKAFGFTYDTESESKFLYAPKGQKPINEYHIDENGEFIPGITRKR